MVEGAGALVKEEEVAAGPDSAAVERGKKFNREGRKKPGGYMQLMQPSHLM